ncbi:hypothetical protein GTO27_12340 [Candidatus Bathyarchaeota archaeon]|nr:hypothetical protein [Candidatus Bathyarchaeota archaeon]
MKILKNRKALSPVVASIILIAVTVAVSIAVAAWMGALTFTFMGTEELKITDLGFSTPGTITVLVKNTGTAPVTLAEAWVNNVKNTDLSNTISANNETTISLTYTWTAGDTYEVKLTTSKGNAFIRTETCPSS